MLHITILWKLKKLEGDAVKNLRRPCWPQRNNFWRQISTKYVLHNELKNFLDHKLVNKCKTRGRKKVHFAVSSFCYTCSSNSMKYYHIWVHTIKALLREQGWRSVAWVRIMASTPYVGWVCCWFSLWELFSPGALVFPSPQKTNISKFQFGQDVLSRYWLFAFINKVFEFIFVCILGF